MATSFHLVDLLQNISDMAIESKHLCTPGSKTKSRAFELKNECQPSCNKNYMKIFDYLFLHIA